MSTGSSDTLSQPMRRPLRELAALPGPLALPLIGNMLQITPLRVHLDMEAWARRYGRLFRVRLGRTPVLVVADHELIAAILRDRPDGFRRPDITARLAREMGGIPGLFLAEGAEWRNQRRMVMQGFAPHAIKAYFPALVQVALRLEQRWLTAARAQQTISLSADLKRYTVDIIAGLAFGTEVNTIDSGDDVIQGHLDNIFNGIARRVYSLVPYWRWFKLPVDRRLDRSVAAVREAVLGFIATARERMAADPALRSRPGNLLEAMLAAADEAGSGVDDATVAGNVQTMLLAGEDTTANTIGWLIHLLHAHPEALARAQEEVRRIAPACAAYSIEQMDAMLYLDACAQEAMRLKPVAPFLPVEATRETMVGDVRVPERTLVWCVLRHESMAAAHFPQPALFDPARWLAPRDGEANASRADKRMSVPFGSGPRTCPGRYLALLEIKIALAMLLGRFDIENVDTADGMPVQEHMGFVMSPVGLRMRLREAQRA